MTGHLFTSIHPDEYCSMLSVLGSGVPIPDASAGAPAHVAPPKNLLSILRLKVTNVASVSAAPHAEADFSMISAGEK